MDRGNGIGSQKKPMAELEDTQGLGQIQVEADKIGASFNDDFKQKEGWKKFTGGSYLGSRLSCYEVKQLICDWRDKTEDLVCVHFLYSCPIMYLTFL